jgi:hypothetical protein
MNELKLFTLHLKPGNAHKQRGFGGGEEIETTLHPLFTTLHLIIYKGKKMIIIN